MSVQTEGIRKAHSAMLVSALEDIINSEPDNTLVDSFDREDLRFTLTRMQREEILSSREDSLACEVLAVGLFDQRRAEYLSGVPIERVEKLLSVLESRYLSSLLSLPNSPHMNLVAYLQGRVDLAHDVEEATHTPWEKLIGLTC